MKRQHIKNMLIIICIIISCVIAFLSITLIKNNVKVTAAAATVDVTDEASLKTAINNATDGVETQINLPATINISDTITIPAGKVITLKPAGSSTQINATGYVGYYQHSNLFIVAADAQLTYNDKITTNLENNPTDEVWASFARVMGKLTINGGTISNGAALYYDDGSTNGVIDINGSNAKFVMNGGTISTCKTMVGNVGIIHITNGATAIMNNGDINNSSINYYCSGVIKVDNANFTMDGGIIHDNTINSWYNGTGLVQGGKFTMNSGIITNNTSGTNTLSSAGVLVLGIEMNPANGQKSEFIMNGGEISHGFSINGAGVYVTGGHKSYHDYKSSAYFTMNGGTITENTAEKDGDSHAIGGGIYVDYNGHFIMNDGTISNNTAYGHGGGVALDSHFTGYFGKIQYADAVGEDNGIQFKNWAEFFQAEFTMNGGTITNNKALHPKDVSVEDSDAACGGGIFVATSHATINGGTISNNYAARQGGGAYVTSVPYSLKINDSIVTNNNATLIGGGLWICPTGDTEVHVKNGTAIYSNSADKSSDDISITRNTSSSVKVNIANNIIGGGSANWVKDGTAVDDGIYNQTDSARYDKISNNTAVSDIINSLEAFALKSTPNSVAIAKANANALVYIIGNTSERGGGIGSNGSVLFGESSDDDYSQPDVDEPTNSNDKTKTISNKATSSKKVVAANTSDNNSLFIVLILMCSSIALVVICNKLRTRIK